ncbi:MAG: helix-turn-helix transcriptional regulator [Chlorobi bacterium]|nr:helix-turn-helix transcriptional regulator [Chlorobiota bacterium]
MEDRKSIKLGKKIRDAMNLQNISVKTLSQKTGIELQTLYSILNGHHQPSVEKLQAICSELQLSVDALLDLEVNTFPIYARPFEGNLSYAKFEDIWLGENGGERISVSRNLSVMNQSEELRREVLRNIYGFKNDELDIAIESFRKRKEVIAKKEKSRLEIVVYSEILDFIYQRSPYDLLSPELIFESIETVIDRLENDPLNFEVVLIPRQYFLVNYEILQREVILFDLGSVFFRQTHSDILQHFLKEVEMLKFKKAKIAERKRVIKFFKEHLNAAREGIDLTRTA